MTTRLSFLIILSIVALPAACSSPPSEGGDTATDAPMDAAVDLQADVVPGDIFPDRTGSPTDVMPDAAADAVPDRVADAVTDMALDLTPHDVGDEPPPDILPDTCQPDCGGKMCGDDGCGGICGICPGDHSCAADGTCAGPNPCGDLTWSGECQGDVLRYCHQPHNPSLPCKTPPSCQVSEVDCILHCMNTGMPSGTCLCVSDDCDCQCSEPR